MDTDTNVPNAPYRFDKFTGHGHAVLRASGVNQAATFSHLSYSFPLKLISPRSASRDAVARIRKQDTLAHNIDIKAVAALYFVSYGGGLVSGDDISVNVDVGQGCTLLTLTQGSTKVYKMRSPPQEKMEVSTSKAVTLQTLRCIVRKDATLILLPDPVTCYANSRYHQVQQFDLRCPKTSSIVLLDWFTPGRVFLHQSAGFPMQSEKWAFESYESRNEIRVGDTIIARDVLLLEQDSLTGNSIAERSEPYSCYATLFLVGPDVKTTKERIRKDFETIEQRVVQPSQTKNKLPVIWSCSALWNEEGIIVRVAGLTTEDVRYWLRDRLQGLKHIVGDDLYRQALG